MTSGRTSRFICNKRPWNVKSKQKRNKIPEKKLVEWTEAGSASSFERTVNTYPVTSSIQTVNCCVIWRHYENTDEFDVPH